MGAPNTYYEFHGLRTNKTEWPIEIRQLKSKNVYRVSRRSSFKSIDVKNCYYFKSQIGLINFPSLKNRYRFKQTK